MQRILLFTCLFIVTSSCAHRMVTPQRHIAESDKKNNEALYSQSFLLKLNKAKELYKKNKADLALKELNDLHDQKLNSAEFASKRNLAGVILFAKKDYQKAIALFEEAKTKNYDDPYLEAQVDLNLGSAYFKNNQNEKALAQLNQTAFNQLPSPEAKKYHQLHAFISELLGKKELSVVSFLRSYSNYKSLDEVRKDAKFENLITAFNKLTESEKSRIAESFDEEINYALCALILIDVEKFSREVDNDQYETWSKWLSKKYAQIKEVDEALTRLSNKNSDREVETKVIGVVLPLTGDKKGLGERAVSGIDLLLETLNKNPENQYKVELKDSKSTALDGVLAITNLVESANVAAIIGGLTPQNATREYLEAKKWGVLFISLSPVLLKKEEKDELLIEIPGSIESQIEEIFSSKNLEKLGRRVGVLYPKSELGIAYVNEFWRKAKLLGLETNVVMGYDKNGTDFKDPVKNILGIKFTKDREDEARLVQEISQMENVKSVKRLQNLQPIVDFDWLFAPANPKEAVQILPLFNYFDAFNLNYVGVPSWRSELMSNEGYRYGNVFFVDENNSSEETEFMRSFYQKYGRPAKLVETIAYDAIKIAESISKNLESKISKNEYRKSLLEFKSIVGESGQWSLVDGVWIKKLSTFKIKREGIE